MDPLTLIFMGRSGSGKGTQAKHLASKVRELDTTRKLLYIETGDLFRDFVSGEGYSYSRAKEIMDKGDREPDFLAVYLWASCFIKNISGDEHIFIDGTPRSLNEAKMLDTALSFYQRKAGVVYLNVTDEWALRRLSERGRADDLDSLENKKRMQWFASDVLPAISHYKDHSAHRLIEIDGNRSIEEVAGSIEKEILHGNI